MSNKNLFKEAIADAKAVREAALANAKAALEEALTPKLQSMLAAKLNEMEYEEEELEETKKSEDEKMEEGMYPDVTGDTIQDKYRATGAALEESDELEEDFDLSEILAELNDEKELEEAKDEDKKEMKEAEEAEEEEEEEEEEEQEVKDLTIEDLKDLIRDIVSQEVGTEEPSEEIGGEEEPMEMGGEEMPAGDEDEIDLEELLAELDSLDEAKDEDKMDEAKKKEDKENKKEKMKKMNENIEEGIFSDLGNKLSAWAYDTNLDTIKACKEQTKGKGIAAFQKCLESKGVKMVTSTTTGIAENDDLAEAIETINTLRSELNEVNLLNAKLLYVNKIFKAKNLTESQKVKVIASFDKATNVKEAKVVFESLQTALTATPKTQIKESLGFASKAAGVAPNKTIVESNDVISRMQKLANIK